jgi:hypothetical protein
LHNVRLAAVVHRAAVLAVRCRGKWSENAELVSFRIGEHDPADVALPDIRPSRAEGEDALDIRLLILRAEVEVEAILDDLVIRNLPEKDVRRDVDLAAPLGWLDDVLLVALKGDAPSQNLRPEASEALAVGGVDETQPRSCEVAGPSQVAPSASYQVRG